MYGKIFEDIFYSSLMFNGGWKSVYVFSAMVVLADENGFVHHDPRSLYRITGIEQDDHIDFDEFMDILDNLEKPDKLSNIPDHEGKRIVALCNLDEIKDNRGWLIVNYLHYRNKGGKQDRMLQNRINKQNQRKRDKSTNVSSGQQPSAMSAHTDTDTDTDTDLKKKNIKKKNEKVYIFYKNIIKPQNLSSVRAKEYIQRLLKKHTDLELIQTISNYNLTAKDREPEYRKDPANFFSPKHSCYLDYLPENFKANKPKDEPWRFQ